MGARPGFAVFCSGRCFRDLSGCSFVTGCGWSGTSNLLLEPQASSRREELQYDREGGPRPCRIREGLFSVLRRSTGDGLDGPFTSSLHRIHEQSECEIDALVPARLPQQAIQCLTPVSHLRRRRTYTLRLTSAGRRTSASHKGQNPSLRIRRWEDCPPCRSIIQVEVHSRWGRGLLRVQPSPMLLYTVSPSQLPDWLVFCVARVT